MVLNKRIPRRIRKNILQYLTLFVLIAAGMYFIAALFGSSDSVITNVKKYQQTNHVEDGQFSVVFPLDDSSIDSLEQKGVSIEKMYSLDIEISGGSTLRVFKNRSNINIQSADEGTIAYENGQIMLEKRYAELNGYNIGDEIEIASKIFTVSGIGTAPDYDYLLKTVSDAGTDPKLFSIAFITSDDFDDLQQQGSDNILSEDYAYSYLLNGEMTNSELKESDILDFAFFLTKGSNPRIGYSAKKVMIYRVTSVIGGVILLVLFSYIIALFVMHNIDKESKVIGTLYSMGVSKNDISNHYLVEPVMINFFGGLVGTILGFSPIGIQFMTYQIISLYSVPEFDMSYQWYIIAYGLIVPALVSAVVNWIAINKKLSKQPLKLLRNDHTPKEIRHVNIKKTGFLNTFRLRNFFKEFRLSIILCIGIIMGMMMLMLPLDTYTCISTVKNDNDDDIKYTYMYTLRQPLEEGVVDERNECYSKALKETYLGFTLDITILGIKPENEFFDFDVKTNEDTIVIAQGTATKYGYDIGDKISLYDEIEDKNYDFTVKDIVPYSVGLTAFMDISSMRSLFGQSDYYYNTVFTNDKLNVGQEYIYNTISKDDILEFTDKLLDSMMPMIYMCILVGIVIYMAVMYLIMKIMIDRSSIQISLFKILGYSNREIRKLYLDGNVVTVIVSAIISAPIAKFVIDLLWPFMVYNQPAGYSSSLNPLHYLILWLLTFACYVISRLLLIRRINKLSPCEVLKDRE